MNAVKANAELMLHIADLLDKHLRPFVSDRALSYQTLLAAHLLRSLARNEINQPTREAKEIEFYALLFAELSLSHETMSLQSLREHVHQLALSNGLSTEQQRTIRKLFLEFTDLQLQLQNPTFDRTREVVL